MKAKLGWILFAVAILFILFTNVDFSFNFSFAWLTYHWFGLPVWGWLVIGVLVSIIVFVIICLYLFYRAVAPMVQIGASVLETFLERPFK